MSDEKTTVIGIDLGTTYSCLSYIDETGNPVVVKNSEGSNTTPSVVHFDPDDPSKYDVGQPAKDNALIDPDFTASFVKRIIGDNPVADFCLCAQEAHLRCFSEHAHGLRWLRHHRSCLFW